jgi:hypothetical protein
MCEFDRNPNPAAACSSRTEFAGILQNLEGLEIGEKTRKLDKRGDSAPIVVGAWAARHSIVMCSNQQNLIIPRRSTPRDFEVEAASPREFVAGPFDSIALPRPLALHIFCRRLQRFETENVTLADFAGEVLNMRPKVLRRRQLLAFHDRSPGLKSWSDYFVLPPGLAERISSINAVGRRIPFLQVVQAASNGWRVRCGLHVRA